MIDGAHVGIVITGDPQRQPLARQLFRIYRGYHYIDEVMLIYRKDPASAINEAVPLLESEIAVIMGGDIFVGEAELKRFIQNRAPIVFMHTPLYPRKRECLEYPRPWSEHSDAFISGMFRCVRSLLLDYPMPTDPPYCEDALWEKLIAPLHLRIVGIQVPAVHVDYHTPWIPRVRVFHWAAIGYERFGGAKNPRAALWAIVKTFAWHVQEFIGAMNVKHPPKQLGTEAFAGITTETAQDLHYRSFKEDIGDDGFEDVREELARSIL